MTLLYNLMFSILFVSIFFTQISSPLSMGTTLLFQTLLICGAAGMTSKSMWFPYILFLIFLGAMLVLFIYVASLASNQQFHLPLLIIFPSIVLISFIYITSFFLDPLIFTQPICIELSSLSLNSMLHSTSMKISMIYSFFSMNMTIFVILYLLLTLLVVVKIMGSSFGPLRTS